MIPQIDLGKINWTLLERIHHSRCYEGNLWFLGGGQNINISRSLEEVDYNPHGWLPGVPDFSGESNCRLIQATELELEKEPEGMTELLQSYDKT